MSSILKINAAVLENLNSDLKVKSIYHKYKLTSNQVLVKIYYSGICGSQLGEIKGIKGKDKFLPHLLGHEATGIVLATGRKNKKFKKNDKVILHWQKNYKRDSALPNYFDKNNNKINAGWITTFNDYSILSSNRITLLPKKLDLKAGVLFGCSITTAYGAIFNDSKISLKRKNKILITGCGMIGQMLAAMLNLPNQEISILENNQKKINYFLKIFKKINFIKDKKNLSKNYDYIFETTGKSKIIEKSFESIKNSGKLILIGVPSHNEKIKINTLGINYGKKIIGSYGGNLKPSKKIDEILKHLKKINFRFGKFYSGPYDFKKINSIIKKINNGRIITKPILKFR